MQFPSAFTINEGYDRAHASNNRSRFGAYLVQRAAMFRTLDVPTTDPAEFAAAAFLTALPPVMSPPYVICHRRILAVRSHGDDDGRIAIAVDLAAPLPSTAAQLLTWRWRGWDISGDNGKYCPPDDNERPAALATVTLRMPLEARRLPDPRYQRDGTPHIGTAKEAVQLTALQLNGTLGELLAALTPRRAA